MKFIDTARIQIRSGNGGAGHVSFRREKKVPKGGPDGGNGGRGGDVIIATDPHMNTLLDFRYLRHYSAEDGEPGGKKRCTGRDGKDIIIKVPCGTLIRNSETNELIADLTDRGETFIVAKGGKGGWGNAEFTTPTNQTPRYAAPGLPGEEFEIELELKLIADVGIVGLPNVGKSTLISVISSAKPKIADYEFTTLVPNLGLVRYEDRKSFTVADIPGLIEGASDGKGLGHQFLRHVERTRVLLFMLDAASADPKADYKILKNELKKYNPEMLKKERMICFSRSDIVDEKTQAKLQKMKFGEPKTPIVMISSVMHLNTEMLVSMLWGRLSAANLDEE